MAHHRSNVSGRLTGLILLGILLIVTTNSQNIPYCKIHDTNGCKECIEGYFQVIMDRTCAKCKNNCKECIAPGDYCRSCFPGYFRNLTTGGEFADSICLNCLSNCGDCENAQSCKKCNSGFFLESTNTTCTSCVKNCDTCTTKDNCQACKPDHTLKQNESTKEAICEPNPTVAAGSGNWLIVIAVVVVVAVIGFAFYMNCMKSKSKPQDADYNGLNTSLTKG